jgi:HSP20 family protein
MAQNASTNSLTRRQAEATSRYNPWSEVNRMRSQMDDLFGRVFGYTPQAYVTQIAPAVTASGDYTLTPDLFETNEELILIAPMPGLKVEDLNIEATADSIAIRGERKPFYTNENAKQLTQSYWSASQGPFEVSYRLPADVDPARVEAQYRQGVLELHIPKSAATRPVSVKVKASGE